MRSTLLTLAACNLALLCARGAEGAPVYDHAAGTWQDEYSDGSGLETANGVAVDPLDGTLKLTNSSGGFGPPYATVGEAITTTIIPVSVTAWIRVTLSRQLPADTSLTLQVLDENNVPYPDSRLPGNQAGFTGPIVSLDPLPVESIGSIQNGAKFARLRLKLTLRTSDVDHTPSLDDVTLSWSTRSGDLSASPLLNSTWPIADVDSRSTRHTTARATPVYLIVRWLEQQPSDFGGALSRGAGRAIFNKTFGGIGGPDGKLSKLDRRTGATVWERELSGNSFTEIEHTVSQNHTLYISDLFNDILLAYDAKTEGNLKWTHQFLEGHGNQKVALDAGGTIYTIRTQLPPPEPGHAVYAFNSDGSIKWRRPLDSALTDPGSSQISVAADGTLHFVWMTGPGESSLYFLDPVNGNDKESPYPVGASIKPTPLVGSDGTIYVASDSGELAEKKIRAIGADRTLVWERSIGQTTNHWSGLSLRSDGVLLAERVSACCSATAGAIEAIDSANGTLVWERPTVSNNAAFTAELFSDSRDGFFVRTVLLSNRTDLYYFDSSNRQKWHLERVAASGEHVQFHHLIQDEKGAVYGNLTSVVAGVPNNAVIGMSPWTLSICADKGHRARSRRINIETSMPRVDPLSGEDNQVQVLIDTGKKLPATYVADRRGGSLWTADFGALHGIVRGPHRFTVEANAAGIETDIPVHMSSPAIGSNNTGVTATGRFKKLRSGIVWRGLQRCHRRPAGR